jgi:hypothetical protein
VLPLSAVPLQMGYIQSWSAYHAYLDQHPESDPLPAFREELLKSLQLQVLTWPEMLSLHRFHLRCCLSGRAWDKCRVHVNRTHVLPSPASYTDMIMQHHVGPLHGVLCPAILACRCSACGALLLQDASQALDIVHTITLVLAKDPVPLTP